MPEQLTKHPQVTLEVLSSAGAQCGKGARQEILKACPAERFCKLPGGELCVYGLADAGAMTQLNRSDWSTVMSSVGLGPTRPPSPPAPAGGSGAVEPGGLAVLIALAVGVAAARARRRRD